MHVIYRDQHWEFDQGMLVRQLLERLALLPENVLVVRNGQLTTEDQRLDAADQVKIVGVISGG